MRLAILVVVALSSTAHASDNSGFGMVGAGATMTTGTQGWMVRAEYRGDFLKTDDDDEDVLAGARIGLEAWGNAERWGFAVPFGYYLGAQVRNVRTSVGGGVGLWSFDKRAESEAHYGVAPFVSTSLEFAIDKTLLSLDGRLARQVLSDVADFNVYSVMLMVGKRFK